MAERRTPSSQTVMTASVRAPSVTPEQDAPRANGLRAAGEGLMDFAAVEFHRREDAARHSANLSKQKSANDTRDYRLARNQFLQRDLQARAQQSGFAELSSDEYEEKAVPQLQAWMSEGMAAIRQKYPAAEIDREEDSEALVSSVLAPEKQRRVDFENRRKIEDRISNLTEQSLAQLQELPPPATPELFQQGIGAYEALRGSIGSLEDRYLSADAKAGILHEMRDQMTRWVNSAVGGARPANKEQVRGMVEDGFKRRIYDAQTRMQMLNALEENTRVNYDIDLKAYSQRGDELLSAVENTGSIQAASAYIAHATQRPSRQGGTEPLDPVLQAKALRTAGLALVTGMHRTQPQRGMLSTAVPVVMPLLSETEKSDFLAAHAALDRLFPKGDAKATRDNFLAAVQRIPAIAGDSTMTKVMSEIPDNEIRDAVDSWKAASSEWVRRVQNREPVFENDPAIRLRIGEAIAVLSSEPAGDPQQDWVRRSAVARGVSEQIGELYAKAGIPESMRNVIPSAFLQPFLSAYRNNDDTEAANQLSLLASVYGHTLTGSLLALSTGDNAPLSKAAAAGIYLSLAESTQHSFYTPEKSGAPMNLNWSVMRALRSADANAKSANFNPEMLRDAEKALQFGAGRSALSLDRYAAAMARDPMVSNLLREGMPDVFRALLLDNLVGSAGRLDPDVAAENALSAVANSLVPVRAGPKGTNEYVFTNLSTFRKSLPIEIARGDDFTGSEQAIKYYEAALDAPFVLFDEKYAAALPWYRVDIAARLSSPFDAHLFNLDPSGLVGGGSDLLTQRDMSEGPNWMDVMFPGSSRLSMLTGYGQFSKVRDVLTGKRPDNLVAQNFGTMNIRYDELHIRGADGKLAPLTSDSVLPREDSPLYSIAKKAMEAEKGFRLSKEQIGLENVFITSQNRRLRYNADLGGYQLFIASAAVGSSLMGRVEGAGGEIPLYYPDGKPVVILRNDLERFLSHYTTKTVTGLRW